LTKAKGIPFDLACYPNTKPISNRETPLGLTNTAASWHSHTVLIRTTVPPLNVPHLCWFRLLASCTW